MWHLYLGAKAWITDCLSQPWCPTAWQQALPRSQENDVPGAAFKLTHTGRLEVAVGWWQWHCRQITCSLYSRPKDTSAALTVKVACSPRGFSIAAGGAQVSVALPWGSFVWVSMAQDKNRASEMNHERPLSQFSSCFANVHVLALAAFVFLKSQW